jgi:hypothetical protein
VCVCARTRVCVNALPAAERVARRSSYGSFARRGSLAPSRAPGPASLHYPPPCHVPRIHRHVPRPPLFPPRPPLFPPPPSSHLPSSLPPLALRHAAAGAAFLATADLPLLAQVYMRSRTVVKPNGQNSGQVLWPNLVVKPCGQTLWSNLVVKPCGQTVWSNRVVKPSGQIV